MSLALLTLNQVFILAQQYPSLTVVIPAYNAAKTLRWCLESILESDYPQDHLEVIVVDNNSTDETAAIAQRFPSVRYLSENRQGPSFARNKGIEAAQGDLIAFLDADTYIEPNWLQEMAKALSPAEVGGAECRVIPSRALGSRSLNRFRHFNIGQDTWGKYSLLSIDCFESPMINSAACLYKREALLAVGGFDTRLIRHEDIDLSKRIHRQGYQLASSEKAIAHVHYHGVSFWDYLLRAFWHGHTKGDYLKKWKQSQPVDSQPQETLSLTSPLHFFIDKHWECFKGFLKSGHYFWLLRMALYQFMAIGRLTGAVANKKNKKTWSNKQVAQGGFTLVQVLVAAAIIGGLSVTLMNIMRQQAVVQKMAEINHEETALLQQISRTLLNANACKFTIGDGQPVQNGRSLIAIKNRNNTDIFKTTGPLSEYGGRVENKLLKILSFTLEVPTGALVTLSGTTDQVGQIDLKVRWERKSPLIQGNKTPSRKIPLSVKTTSADGLIECYSATENAVDTARQKACEQMGGSYIHPPGDPSSGRCDLQFIPNIVTNYHNVTGTSSGQRQVQCGTGETVIDCGGWKRNSPQEGSHASVEPRDGTKCYLQTPSVGAPTDYRIFARCLKITLPTPTP